MRAMVPFRREGSTWVEDETVTYFTSRDLTTFDEIEEHVTAVELEVLYCGRRRRVTAYVPANEHAYAYVDVVELAR